MLEEELIILFLGALGGAVVQNMVELAILKTRYLNHLSYLHNHITDEERRYRK